METWKPIVWFEWLYEVSSIGKVKSLNYHNSWKERILKWWRTSSFYWMYIIRKNNKNIPVTSHRLVWIHFIENPLNLPCVLHKIETLDENWALYNWADNLYWGTRKDNMQDMFNKWREINHFKLNHPMKWKFWKDHQCSKKVNQYTLQWEFIRTWDSISSVKRGLWFSIWWISACCKWKIKTSGWFNWKFST